MFEKISNNDDFIFTATCKAAYHQKKENDKGELVKKNVITVIPDDAEVFKLIEDAGVFKNVGKKFTPAWFKNKEHIILRSLYNIPVRDKSGTEVSFDDWLNAGLVKSAQIKVKALLKRDDSGEFSGVIYPVCVAVTEDGEPYNPFDGM